MFHLQDSHFLRSAFPCGSVTLDLAFLSPLPPIYFYIRFCLFRFRSPLLAKSRLISFPLPTQMFHFGRFPAYNYLFIIRYLSFTSDGFPHSDSCGSRLICSSPQIFAACRVLLRLPVPRHSPCALLSLNFMSFANLFLVQSVFFSLCSLL